MVAAAALSVSAATAQAKAFDGFNDHFNLGRSAKTGVVCEAKRGFDDPLISTGARVWNVTCRGWSQQLGKLYQLPASKTVQATAAWRATLAKAADCDFSTIPAATPGVTSFRPAACKTKPGGLDYVAFEPSTHARPLAAEGMAAIADLLAGGLKYMAGAAPEPQAVAEQGADVGQVAQVHVDALGLAGENDQSAERRRRQAYLSGQGWQFSDAEAVFATLAAQAKPNEPCRACAEAEYNFALNVSNKGRFKEADVYFQLAKELAQNVADSSLEGQGLNYLAAHYRNQAQYKLAADTADQAIAARHGVVTLAPVVRDAHSGAITITDVGGVDATDQISPVQKEQLRDAQALEIKATSLEALGGHADEARATIEQAIQIMQHPLNVGGVESVTHVLGEAMPWLNTQIRADSLRLAAGTDRAPEAEKQFRLAVEAFSKKYPNSLPLAGYLVELAREEAASAGPDANTRAAQDEKALQDYEAALAIFRAERGSLEASADLVRGYFDILLRRINGATTPDPKDVARFFEGAQTLISQSAAEAAERQAARTRSGDAKAAGLARALEDTGRSIEAKTAEIRDLQQRDAYKGDAKTRVDGELKALAAESDTLEQQLLQADPHYASLLRKTVTLEDLQKTLKPGEVYVKAFMLSGKGYGILVSPTEAKPYSIDLTREDAKKMIAAYRAPIDDPRTLPDGHKSPKRFDVAFAHQAFLKIFGPVQDSVMSAKHVIYEPDATLISAPISAFVTDDASADVMKANLEAARTSDQPLNYVGVAWLGNRVSTSTALSATAFVQARHANATSATKLFYGFGNPIASNDPRAFEDVKPVGAGLESAEALAYCARVRAGLAALSPLPDTVREVTGIANTLGQDVSSYALGAAFTDADIMRRGALGGDLASYKVLYFATHGILPQANGCMQSALLTSLAETGGDGLLDEKKIPQLNLDADMIVLSACDTGTHGDNSGGEALGGLVSAFVQAGARNIVVSNWEVDTRSSINLMQEMFAHKAETQADALAAAERKLMASPDQYSHPYFWAPFTVVGDGARQMPAL